MLSKYLLISETLNCEAENIQIFIFIYLVIGKLTAKKTFD